MDKRVYIVIGIVLLVFLASGVLWFTTKAPPPVPTAIPSPTAIPPTNIVGLGGKQFFDDQRMKDYLLTKNYTVNVLTNSGADSYPFPKKEDYVKVKDGFIQAGSINSKPEMIAKFTGDPYKLGPGELPSSGDPVKMQGEVIIGQSPMMMWLKDDRGFFTEFVKAGFLNCTGDICYIPPMKISILVDAAVSVPAKTWKEIGLNIDGPVNLGVPTGSGGRATIAMLLSCWKPAANGDYCSEMITPELLATDEYHAAYNALFSGGGSIPAGDDSLAIAKVWFPQPSNTSPTVILFATESAYASWYRTLSDNGKKQLNTVLKVRGVYLERPIMTTFTMIYMSDVSKKFVESFYEDDVFQQIMSEDFGVRSGMYTNAPTYAGTFIDPAGHYTPMTFPLPGVTSLINKYNKAYGK